MADAGRLKGCDPVLIRKVLAVLWEMNAIGHPMRVTSGYRSPAEQLRLYAQGRTRPGKIVTYLKFGKHNQGKAADCCFLTAKGGVTWTGPWAEYGRRAIRRGLVWGGSWRRFVDKPHVEIK